jgi:hypothetical protein
MADVTGADMASSAERMRRLRERQRAAAAGVDGDVTVPPAGDQVVDVVAVTPPVMPEDADRAPAAAAAQGMTIVVTPSAGDPSRTEGNEVRNANSVSELPVTPSATSAEAVTLHHAAPAASHDPADHGDGADVVHVPSASVGSCDGGEAVTIALTAAELARLDFWRHCRMDQPSRAEAARQLMLAGFRSDG